MLSFHCVHFGKFAFISVCLFTCIQKLLPFMLRPIYVLCSKIKKKCYFGIVNGLCDMQFPLAYV